MYPSAGGFAYTVGDRTGRIVNVEAAAGRHGCVDAGSGLLWHTSHGRYVPGAEPSGRGTSVARGQALDALPVPVAIPLASLAEGDPSGQHLLAAAP